MIRSMTAYARREIKGEWGSATWEMRSVKPALSGNFFVCRSSSVALNLSFASVFVLA